jgi:hypothetical protein
MALLRPASALCVTLFVALFTCGALLTCEPGAGNPPVIAPQVDLLLEDCAAVNRLVGLLLVVWCLGALRAWQLTGWHWPAGSRQAQPPSPAGATRPAETASRRIYSPAERQSIM